MFRSALPAAMLAAFVLFVAAASAWINGDVIRIPAQDGSATPYPSTVAVSGRVGTVTDVNVSLTGFSHTNPDDVDILLVGPTGANTLLVSDACGSADIIGLGLTFDDAAAGPLSDAGPCVAGTYDPTNYGTGDFFPAPAPTPTGTAALTTFTSTDPNGTWSLYVVDDTGGFAGSISGWSLSITTTGSSAASFSGAAITINDQTSSGPARLYPSEIAVSGLSGTITDVNAGLNDFRHTWPDDVDILLVGPTGANTLLVSDACGSADIIGVNLTFDDAPPAGPLPDTPATACTSGTYTPTNYEVASDPFPAPAPAPSATVALANFNRTLPNGTWSLYVVDDTGLDIGSISGWSLDITAGGTTAVEVKGLRARRVAGGVEVSWRSASETDVAGFELYRGSAKLSRTLIAARAAGSAGGASYRFLDRSARPGGSYVYRLQLVRRDGTRVLAGSVALLSSR